MNPKFIKNLNNPRWRINNLYKIKDKEANEVLFNENPIQKKINDCDNNKKIILKARQFGVTTNEVIKLFDKCIWSENRTCVILAHHQDILPKIFNIVKFAYEKLIPELRPTLDRGGGSKYEYRFPDINSNIYTALEVRGGTIHDLHVSEAAFIPFDRLHATFQAVPKNTNITLESTPNGLNHFHDMWRDYDWAKLFYPWYLHEEYAEPTSLKKKEYTGNELELIAYVRSNYGFNLTPEQIQFRRNKISEATKVEKFLKEYPEDDQNCFLASGLNPFDAVLLYEKTQMLPKNFQYKNKIKIYKNYDKDKTYVIGCDPAEGVKSDYSVASVWCIEDREQVAMYREQSKPSEFADIINILGEMYKTTRSGYPIVIVERNNHGHAVILKLDETHNYPRLWEDSDGRVGYRTTAISRPPLIDTFIQCIDENYVKINFKETLDECLTLVDNNGKIEAEIGSYDDVIFADALALKVLLSEYSKLTLYQNIGKRILT